jgi:predicted Zn-dependent peptidase
MNLRRCLFLTAWLLVIAVTADAAPAYDIPRLADRVHETVLDNGLRVVVVERHNAPVFFTLITFRVGSCQESPNRSGLSHFLEHMLFKGSEKVGTTNYRAEQPLMTEMEQIAARIRDYQIEMGWWRYDMFEEFTTKVKTELPDSVRNAVGSDEAAGWRETLNRLPNETAELPEEWRRDSWTLEDNSVNYWALYRDLVRERIRLAELIAQQRQYVKQAELNGIYEVHGSQMNNAFTTPDQTTYMVGLPANCLELWMYLESDRFTHPIFREFYSEREVVMEELRLGENDPADVLYEDFLRTVFTAHPYGRPVIGWQSDIRTTLRSDMENHFHRFYAPNNCQMTVVGDVNAEEVFKLAKKYFSPWKSSEVAQEVTILEPEQDGEKRIVVERDAEPRLLIGYHVPVVPHPDAYALSMVNFILSMGKTSRFYRNIFEQGLTASAPDADNAPANRYPDVLVLDAAPKAPHTAAEVETAILAEIEKLKNEPVSDHELERVRNQFRRWRIGALASNYALAFTLSGQYANRGDWRGIDESLERMMAVTAEDVQRVAQKYFTGNNRTVATLVKPAAGSPKESQ